MSVPAMVGRTRVLGKPLVKSTLMTESLAMRATEALASRLPEN